jgi:hypothetical protein
MDDARKGKAVNALKNQPLISSEDIAKQLKVSEKVTKAKKKAAARNRRKKAVSSEEDVTSSASHSSESSSDSEIEMLDCIVVN